MKDQMVLAKATDKLIEAYKDRKIDGNQLVDLCWYYLHRQILSSYRMQNEANRGNQRQYILDTTLFFAHIAAITALNSKGE